MPFDHLVKKSTLSPAQAYKVNLKKKYLDWLKTFIFLHRVKLEGSVDQLSAYDSKYEKLAKWLKDTEAKVRNESTLKADLPSKVDQSELFTVSHT